jgi:hypothetical protein
MIKGSKKEIMVLETDRTLSLQEIRLRMMGLELQREILETKGELRRNNYRI